MIKLSKKVLVTGANGFIGQAITEEFVKLGYDVYAFGINVDSDKNVKKLDLRKLEEIEATLTEVAPDIILHCAGSADVGKSVVNPQADFIGNVVLTHNLLFALQKCKLKNVRFVFLSSAAVYGSPKILPIKEDSPLNPLSPYALHKVMAEEICMFFSRNYDIKIKIARIFSAYGERLKKQIFWDMYNKIKKNTRLEMFGTGKESRDYIHISDLLEAIKLLAFDDSEEIIYNVANGQEITIEHVAQCFAKCAGLNSEDLSFNGVVREGDPLNWCADISKLQLLGYSNKLDINEGIKLYYNWVTNNYKE